jgi:hypothetical protein
MGRFAEDELEAASETVKTSTSDIYSKYRYWCQNNGETPESQRAMTFYFQRKLRLKELPHHYEKGNLLPGVKLKAPAEPTVTLDSTATNTA